MAKQRRDTQQIQRIAQEKFGYDRLRLEQEEAIKAVLDGHDSSDAHWLRKISNLPNCCAADSWCYRCGLATNCASA